MKIDTDSPALEKGLVTIAIPAYKVTYLKEAIGSALNQDYSNIELVIVNDRSPYDIDSVVRYFHDSRIRYYVNEKNLGRECIVYNWNKCVEYAKGEFFVLLCDDDFLMPDFVSTLLTLAEKYPQCTIFHGRRMIKDEQTGETKEGTVWPEYETYDDFLKNKLKRKRDHTITEFLYRTAAIKERKYILFPIGWGSDDASILSYMKDGGIASSQKCTACFRKNDEHISNEHHLVFQKAIGWIAYYNWFLQFEPRIQYREGIIDEFSWMLHTSLPRASFFERIRIIFMAPNFLWGFKQKMAFLLKVCK